MARRFGAATARAGGTTVSCRPGVLRVSSQGTFAITAKCWQAFVECSATLPEVASVEIDRIRGTAAVFYDAAGISLSQMLDALSAALAAPSNSPAGLPLLKLIASQS